MKTLSSSDTARKPFRRPHRVRVSLDTATFNRLQALCDADGIHPMQYFLIQALWDGLPVGERRVAAWQSNGHVSPSAICFCDFKGGVAL